MTRWCTGYSRASGLGGELMQHMRRIIIPAFDFTGRHKPDIDVLEAGVIRVAGHIIRQIGRLVPDRQQRPGIRALVLSLLTAKQPGCRLIDQARRMCCVASEYSSSMPGPMISGVIGIMCVF